MNFKYFTEIITIIATEVFSAFFIYITSSWSRMRLSGKDTTRSPLAANRSGQPAENFNALIHQWLFPGAKIKSTLFAIQLAIGGILVGGVMSYWLGQKKNT